MSTRRDVIHRKKLFRGVKTAEQVYRELAFANRKCAECGGPPAIRVKVFYPLTEIHETLLDAVKLECLVTGEPPPILRANEKYGNQLIMKVSDIVACERCAAALERAAAKAPSYAIVDIDRGPGKDRPIVQVDGSWAPSGPLVT